MTFATATTALRAPQAYALHTFSVIRTRLRAALAWWRAAPPVGLTLEMPWPVRDVTDDVPVIVEMPIPLTPEDDAEPSQSTAPAERETGLRRHERACIWEFRRNILDRLDTYFVCLRRLRRHDEDAYNLFSRIGFTVPNMYRGGHDDAFPDQWPSFGGSLVSGEHHTDSVYPAFVYFKQVAFVSGLEHRRGETRYEFTVYFDDMDELALPQSCYIGVSPEGSCRVLKQLAITRRWIQPGKKNGHHRGPAFEVTGQQWQQPAWIAEGYSDVCDQWKKRGEPLEPEFLKGPEPWMVSLFRMAVRTHVLATARFVVQVRRDGLVGAFGIDLARAPYFFRDRDTTILAVDGKRKRIFHHVTEHTRSLPTQRTTTVRAHYRGLRTFDWQRYHIHLVLPTRSDLYSAPGLGVHITNSPPLGPEMLDSTQVGTRLGEFLQK